MGKKKKKRKSRKKQSVVSKLDINQALIEKKIVTRNSKQALDLAKQYHRTENSAESEQLLVYSYLARIQSMSDKGLILEANSLLDLVHQSYPQYRDQLEEMSLVIMIQTGSENNLIQLLTNVKSPEEKKTTLENLIRSEINDLATIANCVALPEDYPIRKEAILLNEAFVSVTKGPVTDDEILLKGIPRRSPLSPWKMLINAIAFFYREDDKVCLKYLSMIDPKSAPARLTILLTCMLIDSIENLGDSSTNPLFAKIFEVKSDKLASRFNRLDQIFDSIYDSDPEVIFNKFLSTANYCRKNHPDLIKRFNLIASIRFQIAEIPTNFAEKVLGTKVVQDSSFFRHWARGVEAEGDLLAACCIWDGFRKQAVKEALFESDSPEETIVFLHIIKLLKSIPFEELKDYRENIVAYLKSDIIKDNDFNSQIREFVSQDKNGKHDLSFLYPEMLFEKICLLDPDPEYFLQWHDYAEQTNSNWKAKEKILLAWQTALPQDSRPLLMLMKSSKKRFALKKALDYLKRAESIDSFNPTVHQAHLRLLIFITYNHLRQRKAHLAQKDIAQIEAIPQLQTGDRQALLTALKWSCSIIESDSKDAKKWFGEASKIFDCETIASLIIREVGRRCGIEEKKLPRLKKAKGIIHSIVRACVLGKDLDTEVSIPSSWEKYLVKQLKMKNTPLNLNDLLTLGEAALGNKMQKLAYRVSSVGLANRFDDARFLFIRVKCLPGFEYQRVDSCIEAVLSLAQKQRNMELIDEAVEWQQNNIGGNTLARTIFGVVPSIDIASLDVEETEKLLEIERKSVEYPKYTPEPFYNIRSLDECDCPECQRDREEQDQREKRWEKRMKEADPQATTKKQKKKKTQRYRKNSNQQSLFDQTDELENDENEGPF
ncbi:hypothetical protein H8D57_02295 [bacterium]|nr:hypothetical protein [bacterium]